MTSPHASSLAHIKQALASARLPGALPTLPPSPAEAPAPDTAALVERFVSELAPLHGHAHRAGSAEGAVSLVLELLREIGGDKILAWDDCGVAGLTQAMQAAGYTLLDPTLPTNPPARQRKLAELGEAAAGVTGALAGLADTGTLVLPSGPGRPRLASLLPALHIALLPAASLLPDLPALWARHTNLTGLGSNLVLITGPSRTADIEQTLVIGAHGPMRLHVILF